MLETVTFASDGLKLSGVVHVPDDYRPGEKRPAIIMMHGFGANKNGGPEWICRQFAAWGYVALRFDYRGCGDSEGERGRVIPVEEVADARNAVTYMAARAGRRSRGDRAMRIEPRRRRRGAGGGSRSAGRSRHRRERRRQRRAHDQEHAQRGIVGQIPRAARRHRRAPRAHRHDEDDPPLRYFRNAESRCRST